MSILIKDGKIIKDYDEDAWKVYLIQRLNKRPAYKGPLSVNPFSNDIYLGDALLKHFKEICEFDYMGSAEFEWGAVPAALRWFAQTALKKELVTGRVGVINYNHYSLVNFICKEGEEGDTRCLIQHLSQQNYNRELKEHCGLQDFLAYRGAHVKYKDEPEELEKLKFDWKIPRHEPINVGWLVIGRDSGPEDDHGLSMFFADKEMYAHMARLFMLEPK